MAALFVALLAVPAAGAQSPTAWERLERTPAPERAGARPQVRPERFKASRLDRKQMRELLRGRRAEISLPSPDGALEHFVLEATQVMEPELAAAHPEIRTFRGRGIDDPRATVHVDLSPAGLHASVRSRHGAWYVDPYYQRDQSVYASYYARDLGDAATDFVETEPRPADPTGELAPRALAAPSVSLRTYRIALLNDHTYASYFGSANVLAAKVALINRANHVYEDDFAIRMVLIDGTAALNLDTQAKMTGANGPCGATACFTAAQASDCGGALDRTMYVIGQLAGARNYDIGHIALGTDGGGVAYLGVVGAARKAGGCTGVTTPAGDLYAIDYFAHEVGHQFGGNHTFNSFDCSSNRNAATSVEPGSGSSVMAYAGICGGDDLQPHTDPYFSQRSLDEITAYVTSVRPAVQEVQAVSLTGFGSGDSYTLTYNGATTSAITASANANAVETAIEGITGRTVTVSAFGSGGYTITFSGTTAADMLSVTNATGVTGYVGETQYGGPAANGGTPSATGNSAPVVTVPSAGYTIPHRTPFALTGSATDDDGDALTYLWEQNNPGPSAEALFDQTKSGPLFRQFGTYANVTSSGTLQSPSPGQNLASGNPTRVFPDLAQVVANNTNADAGTCPTTPVAIARDCFSEFLPTGSRTLNFRLTARDGNPAGGGTGRADVTVNVAGSGPFRVTSQAAGSTVDSGTPLTVTWSVASSNVAPINTATVKISLSTNGGVTFPHVLAASTANDGTEAVGLPALTTTQARIKVEAVGNVFFDVNDANFTITASAPTAAPVVGNDAPNGQRSVQYSDPLSSPLTITATDADTPAASLTASATGLPAGMSLSAGSAGSWTVAGATTAAPGEYGATVTVSDGTKTGQTSFKIVVGAEDATLAYTGPTSAASGTVALSASLTPSADGTPGNTGFATVAFKDGTTTLCSATVANGTATCNATLTAGTHTLTLVAGSRYTGTGSGSIAVAGPQSPVASDDSGGQRSVQYSDALASALSITATDGDTSDSQLTASASGLPAGMTLTRPTAGVAEWRVTGATTAAPGDYSVTVTVSDGTRTDDVAFVIEVLPEDADVAYTGDTHGVAGGDVRFEATVTPSADGTPGDLSRASVTFSEGGSVICSASVLTGAAVCSSPLGVGAHAVTASAGGRYHGTATAGVTIGAAPIDSSPPVVATPPPATLRPDLALVRKRLRPSWRGRVALKLRCAPSSLVAVPARCTGTLRLKAARRTIGARSFDIGSASGGTASVKLSAWARRALRTRSLRTTLRVSVANPGAPAAVATRRFALRRIR